MTELKVDVKRLSALTGGHRGFMLALIDHGFLVLLAYRFFRAWRLSWLEVSFIRSVCERLVQNWQGVHIGSAADIGEGFVVFHGFGVVINGKTKAGRNLTIYHRVTIGERFPGDKCPVLGDNVIIGSGAGVFGPVVVPDNYRIKSNLVITPSYRFDV